MLILKFGGSSVGDAQCFRNVAAIIQEAKARDKDVVTVVSAMSGVTDALLETARATASGDAHCWKRTGAELRARHMDTLAQLVRDPALLAKTQGHLENLLAQARSWFDAVLATRNLAAWQADQIASLGERLSAPILAAALQDRGCPALSVEATQIIVTNDDFRSANPLMEETRAQAREVLLPLLAQDIVPVVTGFIGATADGKTTTLGRGGSDFTAGILGACLDADEVQIWTDVDGILTADPRIVPEARPLPELSYAEAAELCYFGAKVLHPKTILPTVERGIPVRILNSFNPAGPGTLIVQEARAANGEVRAITTIKGVSLISVEGRGMLGVPGIAARTFATAARERVNVILISQSSSEQSICFAVSAQDAPAVVRALQSEFQQELLRRDIDRISSRDQVAIVAVVGPGVTRSPRIASRVFAALASNGIQVAAITLGTSMAGISMVLNQDDADRATRYIHRELGLAGSETSLNSRPFLAGTPFPPHVGEGRRVGGCERSSGDTGR
ncbi:MAG: aspartate kinase [Anaerolineae bacterium]